MRDGIIYNEFQVKSLYCLSIQKNILETKEIVTCGCMCTEILLPAGKSGEDKFSQSIFDTMRSNLMSKPYIGLVKNISTSFIAL
jgi:hypothetical protein